MTAFFACPVPEWQAGSAGASTISLASGRGKLKGFGDSLLA